MNIFKTIFSLVIVLGISFGVFTEFRMLEKQQTDLQASQEVLITLEENISNEIKNSNIVSGKSEFIESTRKISNLCQEVTTAITAKQYELAPGLWLDLVMASQECNQIVDEMLVMAQELSDGESIADYDAKRLDFLDEEFSNSIAKIQSHKLNISYLILMKLGLPTAFILNTAALFLYLMKNGPDKNSLFGKLIAKMK